MIVSKNLEEWKDENETYHNFRTNQKIDNYINDEVIFDESVSLCLKIGYENLAM